jgi:DNA-binding SARP family transcriptional activator
VLSLQLLGGVALTGPGGPVTGPAAHRHRLGLLALLAISHPRALSRDKLMALLWPESDEEHGRGLLNLAVHVIRKAAGDDAIISSGDGLLLDPSRISIDVREFEAAVAAAELEKAAGLYGGPFLDGFFIPGANEFDRLIERERERLARLFSGALEKLADAGGRRGDHRQAVDAWLRLAWAEPFNSRVALRLVQALEAAGDRAGALHHARHHTQFLAEEFGAQPDGELVTYVDALRKKPTQSSSISSPGVLEGLESKLGRTSRPRVSRPDTNPESYNLYLKGRYAWNRRTRESLTQSISYLRQAVAMSPDHARSWAALADAYAIAGFYDYLGPSEAFPPARDAALRAAELDPALVQPQVMLGYIALYYDWDLAAAEQHFLAAIARDPTYPVAHQWYGNMLTAAGRFAEALKEMERAVELDPLSLIGSSAIGWVHYYARDFEQCVEACRKTLELDSAFVPANLRLALALDQLGQSGPALEAMSRAVALAPNEPGILASLAYLRARAGHSDEAEKILKEVTTRSGYLPSYEITKAYRALGDQDSAERWLARAREERSHSLVLAPVDPQLLEGRPTPYVKAVSTAPRRGVRPVLAAAVAALLIFGGFVAFRVAAGEGTGEADYGGVTDEESNSLYQRGRYAWNRRTREGLEQSVTYFKQAIARSPDFALAHAGLADAYAVLGFYDYRRPPEAFEAARLSAREALRLAPQLAEPHATLGYVHLYYDWKLEDGEREFLEAIRLKPDYSVAHQWYGNLLTASARFDEAVREMQRAQAIDPQSVIASAALGWVYYYGGRLDSATAQFYQTLELDQNFSLAHQWLGLTALEAGQTAEGVRSLRKALSLSPASKQSLAALAYGLGRAGESDSARALLRDLEGSQEYVPSFEIAKVHLIIGDTTAAYRWLELARQQRSHSIVFLRVDPQLRGLRSDERLQALIKEAGL